MLDFYPIRRKDGRNRERYRGLNEGHARVAKAAAMLLGRMFVELIQRRSLRAQERAHEKQD